MLVRCEQATLPHHSCYAADSTVASILYALPIALFIAGNR